MPRFSLAPFVMLLAACHPSGGHAPAGDATQIGVQAPDNHHPWSGIADTETLYFTGTEPSWSGEVANGSLIWRTPEDQAGARISVTRFSGRNGMGLSGTLAGEPFELAASEAECSDGMSDRRYPFTVTVRPGGKTLRGCGWTPAHPATGGKS